MSWMTNGLTPEQEFELEKVVRSLEPRKAMLYRQLYTYQQWLQNAVWELMRLELEVEELRLELELHHAPLP